MEKMYSYDELASILGCTRTAIAKKVKPDEIDPSIERYKNRFKVVLNNGKKCIIIDDVSLEEEKLRSKGFKNVTQNSNETAEIVPEREREPVLHTHNIETVSDVTERYMNKFLTLQQHMYNQVHDRDKQILLLTVDEEKKKDEYLRAQTEITQIKEKYNVMEHKYNVAMNVIKCFITLGLIFVTSFITFKIALHNVSQPVNNVSETLTNVQQPVQVQVPAVNPPAKPAKKK